MPGTMAPPLGSTQIRDVPIAPMQGPPPMPDMSPATNGPTMLALANLFGSMGTDQPQFSPVHFQGPSPEQATALSSFVEALRKRLA